MTASYDYWRNALAGHFGPVHEGDPQPGFYRCRILPGKDSPWTPIAIWPLDDGSLTAMKHAFVVEQPLIVDAGEIWTWCCDAPITEEAYRAVAENKLPWPSGPGPIRSKT